MLHVTAAMQLQRSFSQRTHAQHAPEQLGMHVFPLMKLVDDSIGNLPDIMPNNRSAHWPLLLVRPLIGACPVLLATTRKTSTGSVKIAKACNLACSFSRSVIFKL